MPDILIHDYCKKDFEDLLELARYGANNAMIGVNMEWEELPAHGDLISRDDAVSVLQSIGSRDYRREKGTICDAIKMISHSQYVPAIIPASEEENANG